MSHFWVPNRQSMLVLSLVLCLTSCSGSSTTMKDSTPSTEEASANSLDEVADSAPISKQSWLIRDGSVTQEEGIESNVWSPEKTVKIGDSYRSYFVSKKDGYLIFAESTDGITYTKWTRTNLQRTEQEGTDTTMMDHPVVMKREDGKFLLVYDICEANCSVPPSIPRRLVARVSDDGIAWGPSVTIPGPPTPGLNPQGKIFDSVPTLLLLPSGDIRVYYVQGGGAIGSATTSDGGETWTIDEGLRLGTNDGGASGSAWHIDPAVIQDEQGDIFLYFGYVTDWNCLPNGGTEKGCVPIRMAQSTDGLNFTLSPDEILSPGPGASQFGDPDVFVGPDGKWLMLVGDVMLKDGQMKVKLRVADRVE